MKTNKKIGSFLTSNAPLLIVMYFLITSVSYLGFNKRFALKDYEKIQIFSATYGIKNNYGPTLLDSLKDQEVHDVLLYDYSPYEKKFYDYYTTMGAKSDFHIMPKTALVDMKDVVIDYYLPLDEEVFKSINSEVMHEYELFKYDNIAYGFAVYLSNNNEYNTKHPYENSYYFKEENNEKEDFYLLINKESSNIKGFNEKAKTNTAFLALNWLMEYFYYEQ